MEFIRHRVKDREQPGNPTAIILKPVCIPLNRLHMADQKKLGGTDRYVLTKTCVETDRYGG